MNYIKLFTVFLIFYTIVSCNHSDDKGLLQSMDSLNIDQLTEQIHQNPNNADLLYNRAKKYFEIQKINEAVADLSSAILKNGQNQDYYTLLAEYHIASGHSENSKDILEKCVKKFPKNTNALLKLAQLHFFVKQYKNSLDYLKQVQEIDENIPQLYFIRGLVLEESGDTAHAIDNFQISTEKNPNYYEAFIILGLRFTDKRDSLAVSYFKNALKIKPNSAEAMYNMALFYQKIGKLNKAVTLYEEVITKIDNTYVNAYYNLGFIHLEHFKDYGKAATFFEKVTDIDNKYYQAWYNRGLAFEMLKDYKKATEFYKQTILVSPEFELAVKGLKRVGKR